MVLLPTFKTVEAGLPQGSVRGTFFFLLYINYIVDNLNNDVRLFTDDTSLFVIVDHGREDECADALSRDLNTISEWGDQWAVTFNPLKTKSLKLTRKRNLHSSVYFNKLPIEEVETHTHLGLTFQTRGNWSTHIGNIYNKACNRLNLLRMLKHSVNRNVLLTLYMPFISPILEYADSVWDNCTQQEASLLENVQVEALRIITGLRRNSSSQALYKELGVEPLCSRRDDHKLTTIFKILNGLSPTYMCDLLLPYLPTEPNYN